MARQKTPTARPAEKQPSHEAPEQGTRRFRSRGVDVEIRASRSNAVELTLDGEPIDVEVVDGKFHSQRAHMFAAFDSIDALVETLLANEGRTWTLHGHVCDARCTAQGHHHGGGHSHDPGHLHTHGGGTTEPNGGHDGAHKEPKPGDGHARDSRSAGPRRRPAKTGRGRGGKR
jgi:hypothetical protein